MCSGITMNIFFYISRKIQQNWKSGITLSLVSLPLSISLAIASQAPPVMGIITAIWAGIVAGLLGGSNYNIIGPTGALSGILAAFALVHGAECLPSLAIVAGIGILLAGLLRFDHYLVFVPRSTIEGFTLGVAALIALSQLNFALGLFRLPKHKEFIENIIESWRNIGNISLLNVNFFLIFLITLFLLARFAPRLPNVIFLTIIGILFGYAGDVWDAPYHLMTLGRHFGEVKMHLMQLPTFYFDFSMLIPLATVIMVAILETMISAQIADGITHTRHKKQKELFGLGFANIFSGLLGGMPATAALARTALNIKSGATHKTSQFINGVCIAIISLFFLTYFNFMPLALIAAILVYIAIRMVSIHHFVDLYQHDKIDFGIAFLVAILTLVTDPIIGILVGSFLSLLLFMERLSQGFYELALGKDENGRPSKSPTFSIYSIKGPLSYINSQAHIARFESEILHSDAIILRFRGVYFIDFDGVHAFDEIIDILKSRGTLVILSRVRSHIAMQLRAQSRYYSKLVEQGYVCDTTSEAVSLVKGHLAFKE